MKSSDLFKQVQEIMKADMGVVVQFDGDHYARLAGSLHWHLICDDEDYQINLHTFVAGMNFWGALFGQKVRPAPLLFCHGGDAVVFTWRIGNQELLVTVCAPDDPNHDYKLHPEKIEAHFLFVNRTDNQRVTEHATKEQLADLQTVIDRLKTPQQHPL